MNGPLVGGRLVVCTCGCSRELHEHLRAGSDCGRCGPQVCPGWRPPGGPVARLVRSIAARL